MTEILYLSSFKKVQFTIHCNLGATGKSSASHVRKCLMNCYHVSSSKDFFLKKTSGKSDEDNNLLLLLARHDELKQYKNWCEFLSTLYTNVPQRASNLPKVMCQSPPSFSKLEVKCAYRSTAGDSRCWHAKKQEHLISSFLPLCQEGAATSHWVPK